MNEDIEPTQDSPVWRSWPFLIGYFLTIVFIIFWLTLATSTIADPDKCTTNFCLFWRSNPNEIGDTFAGLFGSLAFVWIIVTVLVQGLELREQRAEIKAGREAQEAQAQSLNLQAGILMNQNIALQEQRHDMFVEALFIEIRQGVDDLVGPMMEWEIEYTGDDGSVEKKELKPFNIDNIAEQRFLSLSSNLIDTSLSLTLGGDWMADQEQPQKLSILKKPPRSHLHRGLLEYLERVLTEKENCSLPKQLEVQRMAIPQFKKEFERLMSNDEFWNGDFDPEDYYRP